MRFTQALLVSAIARPNRPQTHITSRTKISERECDTLFSTTLLAIFWRNNVWIYYQRITTNIYSNINKLIDTLINRKIEYYAY